MGTDHKTVCINALMLFLQNRPVHFHEIWCAYSTQEWLLLAKGHVDMSRMVQVLAS